MGVASLNRFLKNRNSPAGRGGSASKAGNGARAAAVSPAASKRAASRSERKPKVFLPDGRIFWAVDPFGDGHEQETEILKLIEFFNLSGKPVQPTSIVNPFDMGAPIELFPSIQNQIRDGIRAHLDRLPALSKTLTIAPPAVIIEESHGRRHCAETLLRHLRDQTVRLIVLNSSGRRGLRRLRLGSFAEALVSFSPFPVLVAGPECVAPEKMAQILFPTSLSKESKKTFSALVDWAKSQKAELTLYHLQDPLPPATLNAQVTELWEKQMKHDRDQAKRWQQEAELRGIHCRLQFETQVAEVGERILTAAKVAHADLIVMDHRYESAGPSLFNRQMRMVLAESRCPVLVVKKSRSGKKDRKSS